MLRLLSALIITVCATGCSASHRDAVDPFAGAGDVRNAGGAVADAGLPGVDAGASCQAFARFLHGPINTAPAVIEGVDGVAMWTSDRIEVTDLEVDAMAAQLQFDHVARGAAPTLVDARMLDEMAVALRWSGGNGFYTWKTVSSDPTHVSDEGPCSHCRARLAVVPPRRLYVAVTVLSGLSPHVTTIMEPGNQDAGITRENSPVLQALVGSELDGNGRLYLVFGDVDGLLPGGALETGTVEVVDTGLSTVEIWEMPSAVVPTIVRPLEDGTLLVAGAVQTTDGPRVWLTLLDARTGESVWPEPRVLYLGYATSLDVDDAGNIAIGAAVPDETRRSQAALSLHTADGTTLWDRRTIAEPDEFTGEFALTATAVAFQSDGSILVDGGHVIARHLGCD